jgi:GMP synthase-like glutamine amidotransferase
MSDRFQLLYISQLAEPDRYDSSVHSETPDGRTGGDWMRTRFRDLDLADVVEVTDVDVCFGDKIPDHKGFDAVIIGGSVHSVLEMRPWHQGLLAWLAAYRPTGKPLLGICGGHQLMCQWQGQKIVKLTPEGFEATLTIELTEAGKAHPLFDGLDDSVGYNFGNNEYVIGVPAGAEVLATLRQAKSLALDHGGNWYSIQFHPEISMAVMQQYWQHEDPTKMANYRPTPEAPKLLGNFLKLAGLD